MAMGSMDHEQGEVVICTVAKQREVSSSPCLGPQLQQKTTASAGSRGSTADSHRPSISLSSLHSFNLDALEELDHIEASVEACSWEVQAWRPEIFEFQRTLQHAARNQGTVSLVKSLETGHFVAVKAMPQSWTTLSHTEHRQSHPHDPENPWMDLGIIRYLSMKAVPFVMKPLGIFMDSHWTYCVSEFATEGDLFGFVSQGLEPGAEREQDLQPFMVQIFSAVRWLHDQYIAHCDISMENILVTKEDGRFQVKLIDFSMAVTGQKVISGQRGKPSYQAPEMATSQFYDSFALDCFAMGVVLFCCAARIHPWLSTIPGRCKCFDYVTRHGHRKFWMSRGSAAREKKRLSPRRICSSTGGYWGCIRILKRQCFKEASVNLLRGHRDSHPDELVMVSLGCPG